MKITNFPKPGDRLSVLCLGAHSDDIEIGAGGTILKWIADGIELDVHWCVLSAAGPRRDEAQRSAEAFLAGARSRVIEIGDFNDGYFPFQGDMIKVWMEGLQARIRPDIILTHRGEDAHQDHRMVQQLTWNHFRNHLILEYEIPKWDGDLGRPNAYISLSEPILGFKIDLLNSHFGTQRSKDWFDQETFRGLARLRGVECRSCSGYAEAFVARKLRLG
ncbi:PIG-L deacetylase family protein [Microvirga tunisiensis]|uniref:PIG-L family deacetylase n=1 Tax=Microvirga tunisiensis TaxID=2108360 RepID=A0A5N7N1K9_9HYPH|nr:PIG-L deacetylase family protein [Microvirga tunisiensis]MPR11808.1 PIG-L family deacetylase [Microvirga tunisiensis]MPR29786.1 PIG-L family deacetylase [Microvirga tunisiensis]